MKSGWATLRAFVLWLILIGLGVVLVAMYTQFNYWLVRPLVRDEAPERVDAIIVLGGGVIRGTDTNFLPYGPQERVQRGVELYRAGYADRVIMTGGQVEGETYTESQYMKAYAEVLGVPSENIIEDPYAHDTSENAYFSLRIMSDRHWKTAIVVTSYFHTHRACAVFEKQDADITCVAAWPNEDFRRDPFRNLIEFRSILRDYLATVYYYMGNKL
ncbi:MAG: YdcF family protein [Patescibacteria group bacterium]